MSHDPMQTALSAVRNASRRPVTAENVIALMSTGLGDPSHARALFGDVALEKLMEIAVKEGISSGRLAKSYSFARDAYSAANAELDDFAAEFEA